MVASVVGIVVEIQVGVLVVVLEVTAMVAVAFVRWTVSLLMV